MSKIRIYELAKEVKISSKALLDIVHNLGIDAANHMAGLDSSDVEQIKYAVKKMKAKQKTADDKKESKTEQSSKAESTEQASQADAAEALIEAPKPAAEKSAKKKAKPKIIVKKHISDDLVLVEINGETKLMRRKKKGKPKTAVQKAKEPKKAITAEDEKEQLNKPAAPAKPEHPVEPTKPVEPDKPTEKASEKQVKPEKVVKPKEKTAKTEQLKTDKKADGDKAAKHDKKPVKKNTAKPVKEDKKTDATDNKKRSSKKKKGKAAEEIEQERDSKSKLSRKKKDKRQKHKNRLTEEPSNVTKTLSMQKKTRKKRAKKKKEKPEEPMIETVQENTAIQLPNRITVGEFATIIDKPANEIILKLMNLGVMAAINQYIDYETMELIADDFEIEVEPQVEEVDTAIIDYDFEDDEKDLQPRAPVVTVMGHVDHGKTSLLDAIRSTDVTAGEAGGITQHIGASEVVINDQKIVFLDTPGHEAFTSLRARGAQVTDIAILVVAADDGVMPQTVEAIDHARAADVPIIVAVNKIDKPNANPDRVMQELSEHGVIVEQWGGDTVCVLVSAKQNQNIDQLLEMILLVAELRDLKANPNRNAVGIVIEANLDKGKGAVATVLVQNGKLAVGDPFVCGTTYGRVRAMYNSKGKRIKKVGPSTAVEIIGINDVPVAGDKFFAIDSDKEAKQIAENRALEIKREEMERAGGQVTLEDIFSQIQAGKMKELNLIIKADAHGSLEALKGSLLKLNNDNDEVKIKIQHANIGAITESDILLATASNTIVLGFNVRPSSSVIAIAKKENVEIKTYRIIYELLNDVESAIKGMLDPEFEEVQLGEIEVRAIFKVPNVGTIAGGYVLSGKVLRNSKIRLLRAGVIVHEGELSSLKRFKDDVKEVASGYECGLGIAGFNDLKEGDVIEAYQIIEKVRK